MSESDSSLTINLNTWITKGQTVERLYQLETTLVAHINNYRTAKNLKDRTAVEHAKLIESVVFEMETILNACTVGGHHVSEPINNEQYRIEPKVDLISTVAVLNEPISDNKTKQLPKLGLMAKLNKIAENNGVKSLVGQQLTNSHTKDEVNNTVIPIKSNNENTQQDKTHFKAVQSPLKGKVYEVF